MAKLPGLGPRSARRAVLKMIKKQDTIMKPLANMIQEVAITAKECVSCGNIGDQDICNICTSDQRSTGEICVVEVFLCHVSSLPRGAAPVYETWVAAVLASVSNTVESWVVLARFVVFSSIL